MKEKTLTPIILTKFIVKVLQKVNQNNFLTPGMSQEIETQKIAMLVREFFTEPYEATPLKK